MSRGRGPRPCPDPLTVQLVTTLQLVTQVWLECPASWVSAKDVRWPCEMSTARKHGPLRGADTCAAISTGQDRGNIQASVSIGHLQRPAQVNDLTRTATEGPRCSGSRAGGPARRPVGDPGLASTSGCRTCPKGMAPSMSRRRWCDRSPDRSANWPDPAAGVLFTSDPSKPGMWIRKVDPRPGPALVTVSCPPWASTRALAMAEPMPEPLSASA